MFKIQTLSFFTNLKKNQLFNSGPYKQKNTVYEFDCIIIKKFNKTYFYSMFL